MSSGLAFRCLILLVSLSSYSRPSNQCVIFDKPEELWARADLVFLGTVVSTKPTGIKGHHVTVEIATFRVHRSWKGTLAKTVVVGGDAPFEKDKEYLVFAAGKPAETSLPCRWTEGADRAKEKLDWLNRRGK